MKTFNDIFSGISSFFKGKKTQDAAPKVETITTPVVEEEKKSLPSVEECSSRAIALLKAGNGIEAIEWLAKAADRGHAISQNNLGLVYIQGLAGVPKNPVLAEKYMRMAADQELGDAQFNLGFMHLMGHVPNADMAEAVKWIVKAAAKGNQSAINTLGRLRREGVVDDNNNLRAVTEDSNGQKVYSELLVDELMMDGPVVAAAVVEQGELKLVEIIRIGKKQFGQSNEMLLSIAEPESLAKFTDALMVYEPEKVAHRIVERFRPEGREAVRELKYFLKTYGIKFNQGISML